MSYIYRISMEVDPNNLKKTMNELYKMDEVNKVEFDKIKDYNSPDRERIRRFIPKSKAVALEDIKTHFKDDIRPEKVEEILQRLLKSGEIYEPKPLYFKRV